MAIQILDNQPVSFDSDFNNQDQDCNCISQPFCQLVETEDKTSFQFKILPCGGDLIDNGSFNDGLNSWNASGWTWTDHKAKHTTGNTSTLSQSNDPLSIGSHYRLRFIISGMTAGTLTVKFGNAIIAIITNNGSYEFSGLADGVILKFTPTTDFNGSIDEVTLFRLLVDYKIFITDQNGEWLHTLEDSWLSIQEDHGLVEFIWDYLDLSKGCYRIGIADPCINTNFQIGIFRFIFHLGNISGVAIFVQNTDNGFSIYEPTGNEVGLVINNPTILLAGNAYRVTFTLSWDVNFTNFGKIRPLINGTNGTFICGTDGGATGEHVQIITPGSDGFLAFNYNTCLSDSPSKIYVTNIKVELVDPPTLVADYLSDCFQLADKHECSLSLSWYNIENSFGFIYDSGFKHFLRIAGKLWKPKRSKEGKELFRYSDGHQKILTAESHKINKLTIEQVPEYIHDAISTGIDHDYFIIGEDHYVATAGDYEEQHRNSSLLAPIEIDVEKNFQPLLRNDSCLP